MSDYFIMIQGQRLFVNPMAITVKKSNQLNEKITEARIKNSAYNKLPPKDGESKEAWLERFKEHVKSEDEQKKDESASDYVKRAFDPVAYKDNVNYMYDCLVAIAETFNQPNKVTKEGFEDTSIVEINNFIARVLKKAKVPTEFELEEIPLY